MNNLQLTVSKLRKYFVLLPLIYLYVTIFLLRNNIASIYLAIAVLILATALSHYHYKISTEKMLAHWMVVLAVIGLSASVILSIEKVTLLSQPNHVTSCSISPVVSCSPIIMSPQASALGFPNPFIGVFGFSIVLAAGMTLMAGATKLHKAWWRTLLVSTVLGAGFCIWLIHEGVFEIGKLCLYCMAVWLVTFTLLWLVLSHTIEKKYVNLGTRLNKLFSFKYELIATTYAIVFLLLFYRWSDYWLSLF